MSNFIYNKNQLNWTTRTQVMINLAQAVPFPPPYEAVKCLFTLNPSKARIRFRQKLQCFSRHPEVSRTSRITRFGSR